MAGDIHYLEGIFLKDDSVRQWIIDKSVCRKAPATPGLLISEDKNVSTHIWLRFPQIYSWE